jgi:hypothetical protein
MDTITITVAENDPDVVVSATLNEEAVTITLVEANDGTNGAGVAAGGVANDILKKTSSTDYVTEWETPTSAATANTIVRRDETGGAFFGGDVGAPKYRGWFYQAESATDGAALRNSAGTAVLTWGATAGNISITVDTTSTGHFFSNPGTATAGHFLTKNGTAPTIIAGRSAWFSNASGAPQFKNGTGGAVTLIYDGGALGTPSSGTLTSCSGLPISTGVSGLGTNVAAFLATPTSANLAAAVTDETGTGSLVFATSPTIVTPTISRGSVGQVFTAQDNNGAATTMTTDSFGRNFLQINGKSGAASQAGAYITASGFEEAWAYVNCLSNTSDQRVMRFGNLSNRFSIQRLNDASNSIRATPFSIANDAPTFAFYMLTSGTVGFGTSTPSEKALLDLTSTTKGFLPPRMTTTERNAITSPVAGLMIYNTTLNKLNVYTTAWETVTSL